MSRDSDNLVRVRMGDFQIRKAPAKLAIYGLGSCVAIFLYETELKVAALAHVLLPSPKDESRAESAAGKYASTAIAAILDQISAMGGQRRNLIAKVAGGSHMFGATAAPERETLGERNLRAALEGLREAGLDVDGMDIGGSYGRTIIADASTGKILIRSLKREPKEI